MKHFNLALVTVVATTFCGFTHAQEAENETQTSREYEKLKALEPLVGTYIIEGTNEETGVNWEWVITIDWNGPPKSMLIVEDKRRWANAEEDVKTKDWATTKNRHYFVWNNSTERIEYMNVWARRGRISVHHVIPKGEGTYSMPRLTTTESPAGNANITVKVDESSLVWKIVDRTTPDGTREDDMVFNWKRMGKDE
jgi:hypothetical protein